MLPVSLPRGKVNASATLQVAPGESQVVTQRISDDMKAMRRDGGKSLLVKLDKILENQTDFCGRLLKKRNSFGCIGVCQSDS